MTDKNQPPAYKPAAYETHHVAALQALQKGEATAEQQQKALDWIINEAARVYDVTYRSGGVSGERETCFSEGRRFCGLQIIKLLKTDITKLKREENGRRYIDI